MKKLRFDNLIDTMILILIDVFTFMMFSTFMFMFVGVFNGQWWGFLLLGILGTFGFIYFSILFVIWAKKKNARWQTERSSNIVLENNKSISQNHKKSKGSTKKFLCSPTSCSNIHVYGIIIGRDHRQIHKIKRKTEVIYSERDT